MIISFHHSVTFCDSLLPTTLQPDSLVCHLRLSIMSRISSSHLHIPELWTGLHKAFYPLRHCLCFSISEMPFSPTSLFPISTSQNSTQPKTPTPFYLLPEASMTPQLQSFPHFPQPCDDLCLEHGSMSTRQNSSSLYSRHHSQCHHVN